MIVIELALNVLLGRAKLMPPVLAYCMLDVGQGDKHELGFINYDAIGLQTPHFGSKDINVGPYLLLKVDLEGQNCNKEFENTGGAGQICTLDDCIQHVFDLVIINAFVIQPIGSLEDGVSCVDVHFVDDGFCCPFFCTNNHLIEKIDAIGFFLGVGFCSDGGRTLVRFSVVALSGII